MVVGLDRRLRRRGVNGLHEGGRRVGEFGLVGGGKGAVVVVTVVDPSLPANRCLGTILVGSEKEKSPQIGGCSKHLIQNY